MSENADQPGCAVPGGGDCCRVEAIVSVDERGQLVLPKDVRTKAGIRPGEKLALVTLLEGETVCCLTLIKAERLSGMVQRIVGPLLGGADT